MLTDNSGEQSHYWNSLLCAVAVSLEAVGQGLRFHVRHSHCLAVVLISSLVVHPYHLFPGLICRHQLSRGVLHLAIGNKCIWTTDFLQLSLASIITLLGDEKLYPISLSVCNSFKRFTLQGFPSFPPFSFMESERFSTLVTPFTSLSP